MCVKVYVKVCEGVCEKECVCRCDLLGCTFPFSLNIALSKAQRETNAERTVPGGTVDCVARVDNADSVRQHRQHRAVVLDIQQTRARGHIRQKLYIVKVCWCACVNV